MSRTNYDNWERLVCAILRKEHDWELALAPSLESSFNSVSSANSSSRFSFHSPIHGVNFDVSGISNQRIDFATPSNSRRISSFSYKAQEISFKELKKATQSFRHDLILGKGGFGYVYKGWINMSNSTASKPGRLRYFMGWTNESIITAAEPGTGMAVAVKKLSPSSNQGRTEWLTEINYLSQLRHPNIVKLIGYCSKQNNLLVVYEFAQNGSLKDHLFRNKHPSLPWVTRIKLAMDVARALSFLHDHMEKQIIHRGCNCYNILLDEDFNAILSDFGIATTLPREMTHLSTLVVGTAGYVDPEYERTGDLTAKADVYGFGVVLLELITGRRILDRSMDDQGISLVEWVRSYLYDGKEFIQIFDTKFEGEYPSSQASTVAMIAIQCLRERSEERPRMADVVVALEQL